MNGPDGTSDGRMPTAFISHHSSEYKTAKHLKEVLERNGVYGWMAPDDIEPGLPFDEAIVNQVEKSDLIVLLFCEKSDQSRHVKRELIMADNHKKLVYPIRLEDIDAKGLAYWLNDYQWIDWMDRRDETIQKLVETIKRQVEAKKAEGLAAAKDEGAEPGDEQPADDAAETPDVVPAGTAPPDEPAKPAPAAAAKPAPAPEAAVPVGLMSQPPADGDGAGEKSGFSLSKMKPLHWLAIGGVVVVLAVILLLALGGSEEEPVASAEELDPGQWETRFEFVDARFPDLPDETASMMRTQLGNTIGNQPETASACVSSAAAANPNAGNILPSDFVSWCNFSRDEIEDGEVNLQGTCQIPDTNGQSQMRMTGDYDADSFDSRITFQFNDPNLGNWELDATYRARRTGDCG